MSDPFSRFEMQIHKLVEGTFTRVFGGNLLPTDVAGQLLRALEDNLHTDSTGRLIAPVVYRVRMNPADHQALMQNQPDLSELLADELVEVARQANLLLVQIPQVKLLADNSLNRHAIHITAQNAKHIDTTEVKPLNSKPAAQTTIESLNAALIVDGRQQIPLDKPVVNIGRHRDNDIILDNPKVSRHHAQVRQRSGGYMIFDLDSAGGTIVNGETVSQAMLDTGDIIELAGTSLLYVEESQPRTPKPGATQPFSPVRD